MPAPITVAQVPLLGHHVAHRAGFRRRQFLLIDSGLHILKHLGFGSSSQYQVGSLDNEWKKGSRGRRVEADRRPQLLPDAQKRVLKSHSAVRRMTNFGIDTRNLSYPRRRIGILQRGFEKNLEEKARAGVAKFRGPFRLFAII